MNEITCKVCGDKFTPIKSKRYEVVIPTTSFGIYCGQPMIGEAFDCPICGCQHIANTRYKALKEESWRRYEALLKQPARMEAEQNIERG